MEGQLLTGSSSTNPPETCCSASFLANSDPPQLCSDLTNSNIDTACCKVSNDKGGNKPENFRCILDQGSLQANDEYCTELTLNLTSVRKLEIEEVIGDIQEEDAGEIQIEEDATSTAVGIQIEEESSSGTTTFMLAWMLTLLSFMVSLLLF